MGNYAYLKKIKANGNLPVAIIDFLSTRPTSGSKMATYERDPRDRIFAVKSQFSG